MPSLTLLKKKFRLLTFDRNALLLITTLWLSLLPNAATLRAFYQAADASSLFTQTLFVVGGWVTLFAISLFLLSFFSIFFPGRSVRYLCAFALISAAMIGYFCFFFGIQFDKVMLLNMLQTHPAEAFELVQVKWVLWVMIVGIFPSLALWWLPLTMHTQGQAFLKNHIKPILVAIGLLLIALALVLLQYSRYASVVRNRQVSFNTVAPFNVLAASVSHIIKQRSTQIVRQPLGLDAKIAAPLLKPRLFVLLLGETTRAQNWGLNGYMRDTSPQAKAHGVLNFSDMQSCGTSTAISVPCMFSGLSREEFSLPKALARETLMDVIAKTGVRIIWRDNDSGCKGVCDRLPKADVEDITSSKHPLWCPEKGECHDEILLEGLLEKILNSNHTQAKKQVTPELPDTLVVLHLKGSHGPAYYKRYPKQFEKFTPACQSTDLSSCKPEELINAYDNTVLYTDHMLGQTIALLKKLDTTFATSMMYVSDHGESLGESGLYLHGMPYVVAPKEQTRVPMAMWFSPDFLTLSKLNTHCMQAQTQMSRSHDNIYATLLGLMGISTQEYKAERDIFATCKPPVSATIPMNLSP